MHRPSLSSLLLAAVVLAPTVGAFIGACSNAGALAIPGGASGPAATDAQIPAGADYSAAECIDITAEVPCGGDYVLACCTSSACGYLITDGDYLYAVECASTSDCDAAAQEVLNYCGGDSGGWGGDSGYYSRATRAAFVAAGPTQLALQQGNVFAPAAP